MTNPLISIHDLTTDEITTREMNNEEFARYQNEMAALKLETDERAAKEAAKQAVLNKLGLSPDEIAALLG